MDSCLQSTCSDDLDTDYCLKRLWSFKTLRQEPSCFKTLWQERSCSMLDESATRLTSSAIADRKPAKHKWAW